MYKVLVALIFIFGCSKKSVELSQKKLFDSSLISTFKVFDINDKIIGVENPKLAPGSWNQVLTLSAYHNRFKVREYCLLVKSPRDLEKGEIKIVGKKNKEQSCEDLILSKALVDTIEFYNFFVGFDGNKLSIKADKEHFEMEFPNLNTKSVSKFSTPSKISWKLDKRLKDGEICLKVSDDCSKSEDNCSLCENGHYTIKDNKCENGYSKICGMDNCGLKGQPACIRGQVATGVSDYCIHDSPVGFCLNDNAVGCVEGRLICE